MTARADVVLAYWSEHRQQMRQSEDQRAVLTNYILVIASALTALAVQQGLKPKTLPLGLLIIMVGFYGALTAAKYHERAEYHLGQARALTRTLKDLGALPPDETLLDECRQSHALKHPKLYRVRLHMLWTGLHIVIAVLGLVLSFVTVT